MAGSASQTSLFEETLTLSGLEFRPNARLTDPETSQQAAAANVTTRATDRSRALAALEDAGAAGLTDYELAAAIGRQQNSAGKRRGELVAAGYVVSAGFTRPAPSGSPCMVWKIK